MSIDKLRLPFQSTLSALPSGFRSMRLNSAATEFWSTKFFRFGPGIQALLTLAAFILVLSFAPGVWSAEPFKLQVQEKGYVESPLQGAAIYGYPAPQMVPQAPKHAPAQPKPAQHARPKTQSLPKPTPRPQPRPQPRPPMQASIQQTVVLPPAFMGVWRVQGQRSGVEALPNFQAQAERAFAFNTDNTWQISGNESTGYTMSSNDGVQTPLYVQSVEGDTAVIRYQHPINNTMAQEIFAMRLTAGGAQFNGLTRISIVKQGEPGPRAKVTYQLVGHRQR